MPVFSIAMAIGMVTLLGLIARVGQIWWVTRKRYQDAIERNQKAIETFQDAREQYKKSSQHLQEAGQFAEYTKIIAENHLKIWNGVLLHGKEFLSSEEGIHCIRGSLRALNELRKVHPEGDWESMIVNLHKILE